MTEVAVVVPVYNRRLKLIRTLATVVAQSKQPALLIVVDDGSSDGTGQFAESWLARNASFEWKVIRQANAGAAAARNAGFAAIGSLPFVCFLDSDDLWPPEFLAEGLQRASLLEAASRILWCNERVAGSTTASSLMGSTIAAEGSDRLLVLRFMKDPFPAPASADSMAPISNGV